MTTDYNGHHVTVVSPGHHRLSELRDCAASRFAEEREAAVGWPTLLHTAERPDGSILAVYELVEV